MSRKIYPVILSGGSGTRLWPLSRDLLPKQLLALVGEESLMAATARRVSGPDFAGPVIVCNADHKILVQDQLAEIGIEPEAIIIEPVARNTAPAIAAAAALLRERDPDAVMLVLPSDHIIRDLAALNAAIAAAVKAAETGCLVTFGITPTAPETGYGYIRSGDPLPGVEGAFKIARFVEKPDLATASGYLAEGDWSWNSGMFVFPAGPMLNELASFEPEIAAGAELAVKKAQRSGEVVLLDHVTFADIPSKSIDYALMEKTALAAVVPASLGWSDVGSWSALWEIGDKDHVDNVMVGDVMAEETGGSYLRSHGPLIAALGLKDVVIVATPDVVMAASKDRSQDVKRFVSRLKEGGRTEHVSHRLVNRAWGSFQKLDSGPGFEVKRVTVKPGAALADESQYAEHWTVAGGTARVSRGDEVLNLTAGMSADIQAGKTYRFENMGTAPLELVAVRFG